MIHKLGEEMGTKLAKAEDLGAEGLVVESLQLMEEVENLKKQKAAAEVCMSGLINFKKKVSRHTFIVVLNTNT